MRLSISSYDYEWKYALVVPLHTAPQPDGPTAYRQHAVGVDDYSDCVANGRRVLCPKDAALRLPARIPQDLSRRSVVRARHEE